MATNNPLGGQGGAGLQGSRLLQLDFPQSLAVYDDYAAAQKAVDFLSDQEFPVENCMIVGTDLKQVERITGRLTTNKVALGGALSGLWLGILIVTIFAINLRLFPSGGFPLKGWSSFGEAAVALALPVLTVALVIAASLLRYVRSATQDVIGSDYLRTARALGSGYVAALLRHGLRNGAVPVISILGIELATSFLGAVVIEKVYALPGLGSMLLLAISQRDYPDVQGVLFVSTLLVLLIGFAADLVQRLIDPRLRGQVHTA